MAYGYNMIKLVIEVWFSDYFSTPIIRIYSSKINNMSL